MTVTPEVLAAAKQAIQEDDAQALAGLVAGNPGLLTSRVEAIAAWR